MPLLPNMIILIIAVCIAVTILGTSRHLILLLLLLLLVQLLGLFEVVKLGLLVLEVAHEVMHRTALFNVRPEHKISSSVRLKKASVRVNILG